MRIAVIGSRGIDESAYEILCKNIPSNCTEIVSGGADGIDSLAERYAHENHLKLTIFYPDYKTYGKKAPLIRNIQIIEYAQSVVAFWDGKSKGTAHTVSECIRINLPVRCMLLTFARREEKPHLYDR